jgi:hypothetical protein
MPLSIQMNVQLLFPVTQVLIFEEALVVAEFVHPNGSIHLEVPVVVLHLQNGNIGR